MDEPTDKAAKIRMSLTLTKVYVDALDSLVDEGLYMEHQDAIRAALRKFFRFHGIKAFIYEGAGLEAEDGPQEM